MIADVLPAPAAPARRESSLTPVAEIPVFVLVTLLIVVRFFTERVTLLPRAFNAVDAVMVPLLVPIALMLWLLRPVTVRPSWVAWCSVGFTLAWTVAWLMNADDVHWIGALLFVVGLLAPILWFLILATLPLPASFPARMRRWLMVLLVINVAVAAVDAVRAYGLMRGDFLFGTFGVNQNQLAFFLAAMLSLLAARWRCGRLGFMGKTLALGVTALFVLSGFQTLWVVFAMALLLVHVGASRINRRVVVLLFIGVTLPLIVLSQYRFERFPVGDMLVQIWTGFDRLGKVQLARDAGSVFAQRPTAVVWGVGPGSFNSRAFRSIAIVPYEGAGAGTDVAAAIIAPFYTSPLSGRYIVPYFRRGRFLLSGSNTDGPFTSYVSIPVEVGLLGAVPLFAIYAGVGWLLWRDVRVARDMDLRLMAMWALSCLLMLLGIAVVDNYLETTRYTVLVWLIISLWYLTGRTHATRAA
jgi:hypothetical protein